MINGKKCKNWLQLSEMNANKRGNVQMSQLEFGLVVVTDDWESESIKPGMIGLYDNDAEEDEEEGIEEGDKVVYFSKIPYPCIIPSAFLRQATTQEQVEYEIDHFGEANPMIESIKLQNKLRKLN